MSAATLELLTVILVSHGYAVLLVSFAALRRTSLLSGDAFSRTKFYALMGWVPATFAVLVWLRGPSFGIFFVAAGLFGIVSEVLVSLVWRSFFREPIWSYSYGAVAGGFTSTLNFLPWAMGGLIFHVTAGLVPGGLQAASFPTRAAVIACVALALGFAAAWIARRWTSARNGDFSKRAFLLFCTPIAVAATLLAVLSNPYYVLLMTAFAGVGFTTEYGYGRSMRIFFDRGLWTYHPWKIDGGHTSYVTFPLWAVGGLFFYFLARAVGI